LAKISITTADGLFGPVRALYDGDRPPAFDPQGRMFSRDLAAPTGTRIRIGGFFRPRHAVMGTANSILRRATCLAEPNPFDVAFGRSGGEDMDLFLRLERRGRCFAWCAEAEVGEWVPPSRQGAGYAILRCFVGG
jgi:succinoglycan biosynthesis protein ExoM